MAEFFRRVEKKYILTKNQYLEIKKNIEEKTIEDFHGKSTICNVYYDSPDFRLIRNSITKPVYKDKIRVRSYNTPKKDDTVFLEVKRKYQEVVSKRRIGIKLNDFYKKELEVGSAEKQVKMNLIIILSFTIWSLKCMYHIIEELILIKMMIILDLLLIVIYRQEIMI